MSNGAADMEFSERFVGTNVSYDSMLASEEAKGLDRMKTPVRNPHQKSKENHDVVSPSSPLDMPGGRRFLRNGVYERVRTRQESTDESGEHLSSRKVTANARIDDSPPVEHKMNKNSPFKKLKTDNTNHFGESLLASLIKIPVAQYAKCSQKNSNNSIELWQHLCDAQKTQVSTYPILSRYSAPAEHFEVRKPLVLEEVREQICRSVVELWRAIRKHKHLELVSQPLRTVKRETTSAETSWEPLQLTVQVPREDKVKRDKTIVRTLFRPIERGTDGKIHWFTKNERQLLISGNLLQCLPVGAEEKEENTILAVVLPCNPQRIIKEMKVDIMTTAEAKTRMIDGSIWRCSCITNLLYFDRQMEALRRSPQTIPFLWELLGGTRDDSSTGDLKEVKEKSHTSHDKEDYCFGSDEENDKDTIHLRPLNDSQDAAISSFLSAPEKSISIVQGPPGTGKTTLIVSAVVRFLLPKGRERASGRVLVCAPTNRAISVVALRFLEVVKNSSIRIMLVGDEKKLLDDSGQKNSPLYPYYVYSWIPLVEHELRQIVGFCQESPELETDAKSAWKHATTVTRKVLRSLPDLPVVFKKMVATLCSKLRKRAENDHGHPSDCKTLAESVLKEFCSYDKQHIRTQLLSHAHVVFCTLCTAGSRPVQMMKSVQALVIDEAAAATEPEMYIPFCHLPSKLLLVGDPKQLPATVTSKKASSLGLSRSLQYRLMEQCHHSYKMLKIQYRMHPEICQLPSELFYGGELRDASCLAYRPSPSSNSLVFDGRPYVCWQIDGQESTERTGSKRNLTEAQAVVTLVESLVQKRGKHWCCNSDRLRIITYYRGQVSLVRKLLSDCELSKVFVGTVDASQGCEADIVIISFVRSASSPGFLNDDRRLNVSLTRAKHQLICVGNLNQFRAMQNSTTLRRIAADGFSREVVKS